MRILSIIGTRPEALKMGPVLLALAAARDIDSLVCATGQHRELLCEALALFGIRPDYDLALMRRGQSPAALLAALIVKLGPLIRRVRPDWILGVGDTTSVVGASLVAAHERVRFGHIEAGLRTDVKWDPFPEEFNRRITTVLADLHFAPTLMARRNLRRENIPARAILVTGNPIIDTLRHFSSPPEPPDLDPLWRRLGLNRVGRGSPPHLMVVTFHRRENIGPPMQAICAALRDLAKIHAGNLKILCIIHPNPAVRDPARRALTNRPHIVLSPPLQYPVMIAVLKRAHLILTDSGGLQEEGPWLRVPVLVLRNHTERPEGVKAGVSRLIGTTRTHIVTTVNRYLRLPGSKRGQPVRFAGYGDGRAAERIVAALRKHA